MLIKCKPLSIARKALRQSISVGLLVFAVVSCSSEEVSLRSPKISRDAAELNWQILPTYLLEIKEDDAFQSFLPVSDLENYDGEIIEQARLGVAEVSDAGVRYRPNWHANGEDQFRIRLSHKTDHDVVFECPVQVKISPVSDRPVVEPASFSVTPGATFEVTIKMFDPDGNQPELQLANPEVQNRVEILSPHEGRIRYHAPMESGVTDVIQFVAKDGELNSVPTDIFFDFSPEK